MSIPKRLVTFTCSAGHPAGFFVEPDAEGERDVPCDACGLVNERVNVGRAVVRPMNTPLQREQWATDRSRAAREILTRLVASVEEYVRLHDITIEELPVASPLRRAVLDARAELAKRSP